MVFRASCISEFFQTFVLLTALSPSREPCFTWAPSVFLIFTYCLFALQPNYEYAWVKKDFSIDKIEHLPSTPIENYLTVSIGQKVEIIEGKLASLPELCLVRLANSQQEGLLPINILRYPLKTSIMSLKTSLDSEGKQFIVYNWHLFSNSAPRVTVL